MDDLTGHDSWVLPGSLCGWSNVAISLLELVVVLWIPYGLRMKRLRQRERERFGEYGMPGGIEPSGQGWWLSVIIQGNGASTVQLSDKCKWTSYEVSTIHRTLVDAHR